MKPIVSFSDMGGRVRAGAGCYNANAAWQAHVFGALARAGAAIGED